MDNVLQDRVVRARLPASDREATRLAPARACTDSSASVTSALILIPSRAIGLVLLGLALMAGGARAQGFSIQGNVTGPDGKPVNGASVRIERKNAKTVLNDVKTDQKGNYVFNGLASGTYKLTAWVNDVPTSIGNVKPRPEGAVRVDFDIKPTAAKAVGKKAKHLVWMPSDTGTHMGGRWVEVDDGSTVPGIEHLDKASGEALRKLQSTQTNPNRR